jgi:hypothetical protein
MGLVAAFLMRFMGVFLNLWLVGILLCGVLVKFEGFLLEVSGSRRGGVRFFNN